jgi:hypothetical protein
MMHTDLWPAGDTGTQHLLTQQEAAGMLRVSTRYLRASSVPKVLLPGNGTSRKPLVRYDPLAIRAWWERNSATNRYS